MKENKNRTSLFGKLRSLICIIGVMLISIVLVGCSISSANIKLDNITVDESMNVNATVNLSNIDRENFVKGPQNTLNKIEIYYAYTPEKMTALEADTTKVGKDNDTVNINLPTDEYDGVYSYSVPPEDVAAFKAGTETSASVDVAFTLPAEAKGKDIDFLVVLTGHDSGNGGAVKIGDYGELILQSSPVMMENSAKDGGAVYVATGAEMSMENGTINGNKASGNGAGIYLIEKSRLILSGNPNFGGTSSSGGNQIGTYSNAKREDIYIHGYLGKKGGEDEDADDPKVAESLIVSGALNLPKGSIWVGAEQRENEDDNHWDAYKQFAVFSENLMDGDIVNLSEIQLKTTFEAFRNATASAEYYGTAGEIPLYLYWEGPKGSHKVILRKVNEDYQSLLGARFEIHKGSPTGPLVSIVDENGNNMTLFTSLESGVYFVGYLDYGIYYLHEITIPTGYQQVTEGNDGNWYILTVGENGVGYERVNDSGDTVIENALNPETTKPN